MNKILDIRKAVLETNEELMQAEQNFQFAEKDFINAAVYEILAKKEKLNALLKKAKEVKE